jgi:3-oxoacyl-[acyl-carrier-protein] synthase-1
MDNLCKLGFIGAELLLKDIAAEKKENAAIILFNRSGSLVADRNYQKSIIADNYFPSPALFVYTLANIVTGEIAIRHKIYGESSFYILPRQDTAVIDNIVDAAFLTSRPDFVLTGWIEYESESDYIADLKLVTNNK